MSKGVTPHPSPFTQSPLLSTLFPSPSQNSHHINSFPIAIYPFLPPFQLKRETSPKSSHLLHQTLAPRNPNLFTSISSSNFKRSSRVHQGHHLQPPSSKATPRRTPPSQAPTSTQGLKPPSSSSWIKPQIQPLQVSTLLTKT